MILNKNILALVLFAIAMLLASCSIHDDDIFSSDGVTIKVIAPGLSVYNVTTRGSDAKSVLEKEIKSLYIFVYDSNGEICNYVPDANAVSVYQLSDINKSGCTIYAVANVSGDMFKDLDNRDYPRNALKLNQIKNLNYIVGDIVSLDIPTTGIPMIGSLSGADMRNGAVHVVELKALMARIDLVLSIKSEHQDSIGNDRYPQMKVNSVTINNIPTAVPFTPLANDETTPSDDIEFVSHSKEINSEIIKDHIGELRYSFYVYENMQGTKEYDSVPEKANAQNYKPLVADSLKDMHLVFNSVYYDVSGNIYDVDYTLYLGANHTNDFNVKRNHQYVNTITIKGINKTNQSFNETISFDARVEVNGSATGQDDFYISMINERDLDAHYAVVPMDIYLIDGDGDNTNNPINKVTVSIAPDDDGDTPDWLRLEAPNSFNGTAYNGIRDYFTTDLVTDTLNDKGKSAVPTPSTDGRNFGRVYIYVDENLTTKDYEAKIKVTYNLENGYSITRTVIIRQLGLLEVTYTSGKETSPRTVYMERYEEYLEHWDPLDPHVSTRVYEGLPWQNQSNSYSKDVGVGYATSSGDNATVYVDGLTLTKAIYSKYNYNTAKSMKYGIPESAAAAEYCYDKNKKQSSGSVDLTLTSGWYMPAIRELEAGIEQNYTVYPEFQNNFYWSSAPAKKKKSGLSGLLGREEEQTDRSRATKIGDNLGHVESGTENGHTYENGGGRADRDEKFRVRAFWKGTSQSTRPYSNGLKLK